MGFFGKPQNDKADYAARDFHGTALPRLGITKEREMPGTAGQNDKGVHTNSHSEEERIVRENLF